MSLLLKYISSSGGGATVLPPVGTITYLGFAPQFVNEPSIVEPPTGDLTYTGFAPVVTASSAGEVVRPTPYEWKRKKYKSAEEIAEEIRQQRIKLGILPPDEIELPKPEIAAADVIAPEIAIDYASLAAEIKSDFTRARYKSQIKKLEKLIAEYQKALAMQEEEEIAIAMLMLAA